MVTLHDSLLSSSARALSLRRRPDLIARRQHYLGRSYWIVKDPVGLNYFRFQEEEYALLNWLDGNVSLDELKDRFENEYPPQKITLEELQQFLGMLHRSGLAIASVGGQGKQLLKRRRERRWKEFTGSLANVLCIRFKGFDPERFLNWLYPWVRWFYSPAAVAGCILLGLSALTLVAVQFQVFTSRLPAFHDVLQLRERAVALVHAGRDQGPARVRPRPDVQALRRRMSRNGRDGPRAHALPVLQRLRLLAAAQQVGPRGHRRRRHVRRAGPGLGRHLDLVVQRAGPLEPPLPEHDVRLLGQHLDLQRQSALAVRRLLHPLRHHRNPQPAAEVDQPS